MKAKRLAGLHETTIEELVRESRIVLARVELVEGYDMSVFKANKIIDRIKDGETFKEALQNTNGVGCEYCDIDSKTCSIFVDPLDGEWYWSVCDPFDDDVFELHREYGIKYCPYCGRKIH